MGIMNSSNIFSYLLPGFEISNPSLADVLNRAHNNRCSRLLHYANGATLRGVEELLSYLHEAEKNFSENSHLKLISRLVKRLGGDFETGIEAFLAGFHSVLFDTMRDVMEIEFLLRDFLIWPTHLDEWFNCNDEVRYNRFRPAVLRQRYANFVKERPQDLQEATDYKAHSQFLHVTPYVNPSGQIGISDSDDPDVMGHVYGNLWHMLNVS